ncbi:CHAT domain-containing protein [Streptomyces sp. NPDC017941]|uniref:CHAT domain-containing protein n=1 Tax=Streptomyces sp. NPDC017941 TaxID=3365018 RepID=UPI0037A54E7F
MAHELPTRITHDPSLGFTRLPRRVIRHPDLVVGLDARRDDENVRARMYGPAVPSLSGSEHTVTLRVRPGEVRRVAARLRQVWRDEFVALTPLDPAGRPAPGRTPLPYASLVDLTTEPEAELRAALSRLALYGTQLLYDVLLGGDDEELKLFRGFLTDALSSDRALRIRFHSDLFLPWPMLCLPAAADDGKAGGPGGAEDAGGPGGVEGHGGGAALDRVFARFLGYRHQLEHTGGNAYARVADDRDPPPRSAPAVSLNHDTGVDAQGLTLAAEVAAALAEGTDFVERTTRAELERALRDDLLDEQLMYFWCHGHFTASGDEPPYLVLKLTDQQAIDAYTLRAHRPPLDACVPFRPFVLLNACYAGLPGNADLAYLGRALFDAGAGGILGPQIEMPQRFAAEYALAFVTRYLAGRETAGGIAHSLARHFADTCRNPLGFAYALHSGMDSRLERTA